MPDNKGGDHGGGAIKSRSAQSGPPDDKERDRTQRGDQGDQEVDQLTKSGKQRDQQNDKKNAERSEKSGTGGQRPGSDIGDNDR